MHYKIKELHRLITTLKNEEGLSDYGVTLLEGYAVGLEIVVKNYSIPAVSCSFSDGEIVMYEDDKVEIQGIWKDWATIKFDDGNTINVGINELRKLGV